jgi:serine/threonine protein kinase
MGAVYLGRDDATGTAAAVKLIRPEHTADPQFRARLRREITAARQVPRFCTAPVIDADPDANPPWIATEYIDAPSLDVAVLVDGVLAGADLEAFAVAVAVALRAIHEHGVIHRDLKPSNILMSPLGPRVIDFGIARPADPEAQLTRLTHTGIAIGTPAYMAPEQLIGAPITPAVDVYAWAGLVRYAATGRPPAVGTTPEDPLSGLPQPLQRLVAEALADDPAARPAAATLVDRLSRTAATVTTQVLAAAAARPADPIPAPPVRSVHTAPTIQPTVPAGTPPPAWSPAPARSPAPRRARGRPRPRRIPAAIPAVLVLTMITADAGPAGPSGDPGRAVAIEPAPAEAGPADEPTPSKQPSSDAPPFGSQITEPLRGHTHDINAVAVGELDGVPIAVSGGDRTARVWDLTTGEQIGPPLVSDANGVDAVAVGELDGVPIVVTGNFDTLESHDRDIQLWDLTTREQIRRLPAGDAMQVQDLAVGERDGTPIVVAGDHEDSALVWNLATGEQIGPPLTHASVRAVAIGELDGVPVALIGGGNGTDNTARVWDLTTGEPIGPPLAGHTDIVFGVAISERRGTPIAVTCSSDMTVRRWELATGEPIGQPLPNRDMCLDVAVTELDGIPVAVTAGLDGVARVWNLLTGQQVGSPLVGHTDAISSVAVGEVDGTPIAVTISQDRTVRTWSLAPPGS